MPKSFIQSTVGIETNEQANWKKFRTLKSARFRRLLYLKDKFLLLKTPSLMIVNLERHIGRIAKR